MIPIQKGDLVEVLEAHQTSVYSWEGVVLELNNQFTTLVTHVKVLCTNPRLSPLVKKGDEPIVQYRTQGQVQVKLIQSKAPKVNSPLGTKQVIIMRTHYPDGKGGSKKVRTGKLIAQGCHASLGSFLKKREITPYGMTGDSPILDENKQIYLMEVQLTEEMQDWITGSFTKVVVYVETEEELRAIYGKALEAGLPCALIEDNGTTEFHGVLTPTAVAVGPARDTDLKPITGHLPLL